MSLLSVLNVGTRGLMASQLAMDVAGQNISNADVKGYSRKRLNLAPDYRYDSTYGQMGMGVEVINIERMRSGFIDNQIRLQNQEVGYFDEINQSLSAIENVFTEPGDTGIQTFIDQFFDSWQNLSNNPSDISARTMVKTNAEILNDVFHNLAGELTDLRQTRNTEIETRVEKVNEIVKEVYNLNLEIGSVEIGNQNANDSRDRRDRILKDLSLLIDINTTENDLGQLTVTTNGNILVSPVNYQTLVTTSASFQMPDGTSMTNVGIKFSDSRKTYMPQGGEIKGLIEVRDAIVPEYQKKLDDLALAIVHDVNSLHVTGYNLDGYSGNNFFDPDTTGASDISIAASINASVHNIAAASGGEIEPAFANTFAAGAHNFGAPPLQLYRDPGAVPVTPAANIMRGSVIVNTGSTTLQEGTDYHIDYVSGTIQMLHNGYDAQNLTVNFQYRTGGFAGPGDNSNSVAIAALRSDLTMSPDVVGNNTATYTEYYSSVIGFLGLSKNEANSSLETRTFLVDQYESQQDSIAGVSLDEEMADLIKYQHTYQAAARLISLANDMLDTLINM
ncbi:MAG: flagellar hook-associated protein FlgK [Fibrobacterota bacterium]